MTTTAIAYLRSEYNPEQWQYLSTWSIELLNSAQRICLKLCDVVTNEINSDIRGQELKQAVDKMFDGGRSKYTHFCNANDFILYLNSRVSKQTMDSIYKLYAICDRIQAIKREITNRHVYGYMNLDNEEAIFIASCSKKLLGSNEKKKLNGKGR